jgi:hypothetical protein
MGERHGASRGGRPDLAASAVPLTTRGFSLDNALGCVPAHYRSSLIRTLRYHTGLPSSWKPM